MIKAESTLSWLDQALVGFIFVIPLLSFALQLLFLQENTTKSSSGLTLESKDDNHQRKPEEQVGLTISSNSVTNSLNEQLF